MPRLRQHRAGLLLGIALLCLPLAMPASPQDDEAQARASLAELQARIKAVTGPGPGAQPAEQRTETAPGGGTTPG